MFIQTQLAGSAPGQVQEYPSNRTYAWITDRYHGQHYLDLKKCRRQNSIIKESLNRGNKDKIYNGILDVIKDTLSDPKVGNLSQAEEIVEVVIWEYLNNPEIVESLLYIVKKDDISAMHSLNTGILTIAYCFKTDCCDNKIYEYGLGGLLHDIGKTGIESKILNAPSNLTDEEFEKMKTHTSHGYHILKSYGFSNNVAFSAWEHHERMDGSGYPEGKKDNQISEIGQMIAIIDEYDAHTSARMYKCRGHISRTIDYMRGLADAGKFNKRIFESFVGTLKITQLD